MIVIDMFEAVIIAILARLITRNGVTYSLKNDRVYIYNECGSAYRRSSQLELCASRNVS